MVKTFELSRAELELEIINAVKGAAGDVSATRRIVFHFCPTPRVYVEQITPGHFRVIFQAWIGEQELTVMCRA